MINNKISKTEIIQKYQEYKKTFKEKTENEIKNYTLDWATGAHKI